MYSIHTSCLRFNFSFYYSDLMALFFQVCLVDTMACLCAFYMGRKLGLAGKLHNPLPSGCTDTLRMHVLLLYFPFLKLYM